MKAVWGALIAMIVFSGLVPASTALAVNTNNFTISSYDIQYELSRDSESRSVLKTTERITAQFPQSNQNRGIERAIPTSYDGHSTSLKVDSVKNSEGTDLEYSTNNSNGVEVLRIGDPDKYVHGTQVYEIIYSQRDVTRNFADTNRAEWYWDTNGTDWKVPIENLTVSVKIDGSLIAAREGDPACYEGAGGSTDRCTLIAGGDGSYSVTAQNLRAGENVTVAFGFTEGTFGAYQQSLAEKLFSIWIIVFIVTSLFGVIALIIVAIKYGRWVNRTDEITSYPAEYIPPKNTSVLVSSQVLQARGSIFGAQLIDLAVRHKLAIIETRAKSTWRVAEYDIKILADPSTLLAEEQELLSDMFGHLPRVGESISLKTLRTSTAYATRTLDNDKNMKALIEGEYGIRTQDTAKSKYFYRWAIALCVIAVLTLSPLLLIFGAITALFGGLIRPLTDKGLELRQYLLGLDKYIKAAEVERLKFLQGPDTAEKVGFAVNTDDAGQMVKLYERVLPYAILFGREKEWSKRLGDLYASSQASPDWYTGQAAFNGVMFGSMMSSFSQSTSYSAGSSSSTGGSAGGGSSGGGGGGGGGGGW